MLPGQPEVTAGQSAEITQPLAKEVNAQDYEPITDTANVKRFVSDYFEDTPILARIAGCESQNRQYDSRGNVLRGQENRYDVGVMQINEKYHLEKSKSLGMDIYTIEGNVAYAKYIYDKQGAKPWMASSPCWAKFTQKEIARR